MKILLTGATGFLGHEVLRQALDDDGIHQVTTLTRRPVGIAHPKLHEALVTNFLDYSTLDLRDCDACIWSLGVSQLQTTEEQYIRITLDFTMAAARALFAANPRARFCFVSGRNADPEEKKSALYARIKGRTERQLEAWGDNVFVFRPAYIRPTKRSGPRRDLARLFAPIGTVMSMFGKDLSVDCDKLAFCLLDVAKHGAERHLLVNSDIRDWKAA
ncbi:NAD-dependent epimerase/dehydratase family protein [Pendulispora rubella]|uniref:NAD-dependent epimerase/dehydratase family protein n=1 Tax=Pendulispora rubella TaxID=2741070 RepID=A0ABZ2L6G4_9BACT